MDAIECRIGLMNKWMEDMLLVGSTFEIEKLSVIVGWMMRKQGDIGWK